MIGRLKKVPVSEMYGEGEAAFTAWLHENLDVLNEAAGISLSGVHEEASPSAAEVVARDGSGDTVVIEHEPGESGDEGLGRLVASLASVGGRVGAWIVADARPKHVAAVSWLNEASAADLYLLKVEAFRIDDSPPAPMMTLVSGPSIPPEPAIPTEAPASAASANSAPVGVPGAGGFGDASEEALAHSPEEGGGVIVLEEVEAPVVEEQDDAAVGALEDTVILESEVVTGDGRDTTGLVLYQFWAELLEKAAARTRIHADVGPEREPVVGVSAGVAGLRYNYVLGEDNAGVELYVDRGEGRENEQIFNALGATEDAIAYNFGGALEWRIEDSGARRIEHRIDDAGGYRDEERWPALQDAMIDAMIRLEKALRPHVSRLAV